MLPTWLFCFVLPYFAGWWVSISTRWMTLLVVTASSGLLWGWGVWPVIVESGLPTIFLAHLLFLAWFLVGLLTGGALVRCVATFGWEGYVFVVSAAAIGIALGDLIDAVLRFALGAEGSGGELARAAELHVLPLTLALVFIMQLGGATLARRLVARKLVTRVSMLGLFSIASQWAFRRWGMDLVWPLPVPAPEGYDIAVLYAAGWLLALPWFVALLGGEVPRLHGGAQMAAAKAREGLDLEVEAGATPQPCLAIPLPMGWQTDGLRRRGRDWIQSLLPPERGGVRLELIVCRYEADYGRPPFRPEAVEPAERLRRTTDFNLAKSNASITHREESHVAGAPFHECWYRRRLARGYVASTIRGETELIFLWESTASDVFRRWLLEVRQIARGTRLANEAEVSVGEDKA